MITERRVFDDTHLPRELMHREGAVEALCRAFDPAIENRPADNVLLSGPSGVGKTVLARHTLAKLDDYVHVPHAHVRCLGETTGSILRQIVRAYPGAGEITPNTPTEAVREQLWETVDEPYIVILDEAEDLPKTDALDALVGIPRLSIVVICHDQDQWLVDASPPVRRAIDTQLQLDRFAVNELADILEARADQGLRHGVVDRDQLETIADEVAGVARYGIQALRAAAEIAAERGHREIRDVDVEDSFERARQVIRESNLRSLPFHHQVLYALVHRAGEIGAAELHRQYDRVKTDAYQGTEATPITRRSRRAKLAKLRDYDLVAADGTSRDRVYHVRDPAVEPLLDVELNQQRAN